MLFVLLAAIFIVLPAAAGSGGDDYDLIDDFRIHFV